MPGQLPLFATLGAQTRPGVDPASRDEALVALAHALPEELRLGTSSWSFPGWAGLVYRRRESRRRLAREGLAAYARHPLLRTVGIDRSYYAPLEARAFAAYAAQVPPGFRFVVKAHELCVWPQLPQRPTAGAAAGRENPRFLDVAHAVRAVIDPLREGLGERAGPLVFQLPPLAPDAAGDADAMADRLHGFLSALPRGPLYAVELRTAAWLTPRWAAALRAADAVACLTVHPRMPDLARQRAVLAPATERALVVRWNLGHGLGYETARERYAPFDRLVAEDRPTRRTLAGLCVAAAQAGRPAWVTINNKAEGSAPHSVVALARAIAERVGAAAPQGPTS